MLKQDSVLQAKKQVKMSKTELKRKYIFYWQRIERDDSKGDQISQKLNGDHARNI